MPNTLFKLDTPALIVRREVLLRNLQRISSQAKALRVDLRPHLKTAKSIEIAKLATLDHSGAIAVSTLKEAEYFAGAGFSDILYAIQISPGKLARLQRIQSSYPSLRLLLITDSLEVVGELSAEAGRRNLTLMLLVDVDSGYKRSGVAPKSAALLDLARAIHEARHLELCGVMTHAGQSYEGRCAEDFRDAAEQERGDLVESAERLRSAGLPCPIVSAGSTPTSLFAASAEGLTEIRPGNGMFFDLSMSSRGVCVQDEIAVFVLATVISRSDSLALADAGALALSRDPGLSDPRLPSPCYGLAFDPVTGKMLAAVSGLSQEQGWLRPLPTQAENFATLRIGQKVGILPNHSCLTCSAYEGYHVLEADGLISDYWERVNGW